MSDYTLLRWSNIPEDTPLKELVRILNRRKTKISIEAATSETPIGTGPAGLANCLLWWRAHDLLLTKTEGDKVAFIPDASQNGKHGTQGTGSKEATFRLDVLNGYPVLEFTGDDFLISPDVVKPTTGSGGGGSCVFIVVRRNGSTVTYGGFQSFAQTSGTSGDEGAALKDKNTTHFWWGQDDTHGGDYELTTSTTANWTVVSLDFASVSSLSIYIDGALDVTFNPNSTIEGSTLNRMVIGAVNGSGVFYGANSQIAEVVWFDGPFSSANRATVEDFLANKYNL